MKLKPDDTEVFFSQFHRVQYKPRERILTPFDIPLGVFYLSKGFVRLSSTSAEGRELTIHFFVPKSFFPLTWALSGTPNTHTYMAMSRAEVYIAPKEEVVHFLTKHPTDTLLALERALSGIHGLTKRLESITFGTAYHRVISVLLYLASHFGTKKGKAVVIRERFTHQDIASLCGLSREHVSLELETLKRKGFIQWEKGTIIISTLKALSAQLRSSYR